MTEDKAKTKWCPMVRAHSELEISGKVRSFSAVNAFRGQAGEDIRTFCIGSACMMWRDNLDRVPTGREVVKNDGVKNTVEIETVPSGYCGLAGKP